jgi:hypothetical protein
MFKNAAQFSLHIEQYAVEKKMSHMDAVLKYCIDKDFKVQFE